MIKVEVASQIFGTTLRCKYVAQITGDVEDSFTGVEELSSTIVGEYKAVILALTKLPDNIEVEVFGRNLSALSKGKKYNGRHKKLVSELLDIIDSKRMIVSFNKAYYRRDSDLVQALNKVQERLKDLNDRENEFFKGIYYKAISKKVAM